MTVGGGPTFLVHLGNPARFDVYQPGSYVMSEPLGEWQVVKSLIPFRNHVISFKLPGGVS